jgi:hypothetical protein
LNYLRVEMSKMEVAPPLAASNQIAVDPIASSK